MYLIQTAIKKLGLSANFQALVSAEKEVYGKPHPAVFLNAASLLDVEPHRCLVFEDSFHGVVAALAARMKVVAVPSADMLHDKRYGAASRILPTLHGFTPEILADLG